MMVDQRTASASRVTGSCPVCDVARVGKTCGCGYDFDAHDPRTAIERLALEARSGNRTWLAGFVALVSLPVTFVLGGPMWGLVLALLQFGFSAGWIVQGLVRADRANKRLSAAKQLMALPEARIVQHSQPKARS